MEVGCIEGEAGGVIGSGGDDDGVVSRKTPTTKESSIVVLHVARVALEGTVDTDVSTVPHPRATGTLQGEVDILVLDSVWVFAML